MTGQQSLRDWALEDVRRAALLLAAACLSSVLAAQFLFSPPSHDLRALAVYVLVSGAASIALGAAAFHWSTQRLGLRLGSLIALGAIVGSVAGLLNVLVVARLMFVSTSHDLGLLAALTLSSGIIAAGFSLWVAARLSTRVATITKGIQALADGRYDEDVRVPAGDELSELAADVNLLARRLRDAEADRAAIERERRDMTAAVSHDLRTPLGSMRAMIEALADELITAPADRARYYRSLAADVERLSRLVDDLFQLAQFDSGAVRLERRTVALEEIAREVTEAVEAQARSAGVAVVFAPPAEQVLTFVDGFLIERAIRNLIVNAIEHTPSGGVVRVRASKDADMASVLVEDTGDGIASADLPRIWDRFYRAERSRTRSAGSDGVGLGLAIVHGTVSAHGGSVMAASEAVKGARLGFTIPLAADV